ncbi:MAG: polyprenyl synthetase family protein [Clostridiales bacterium]|nr:polyprenyl synthetase family protein [Clostridiales bacterium]
MNEFQIRYNEYLAEFEKYLQEYAAKMVTSPTILGDSMRYSLLCGGKRVRPVLALACADALGLDKQEILPFALALEMIHTYSLIHDDLPAMDNDDFRRGKPSNHKQFGEANAILAGDALLNEAYSICFRECAKGEKYAVVSAFLNECAGIYGMIAGQSADMQFSEENRELTEEDLFYVYEHKTGKLLLAPVAMASILSGNKSYLALEQFGKLLGKLFQMTDDILDVTGDFKALGKSIGKDETENKWTCVRLYGLEGAKIRAAECAMDALAILEGVEGDVSFLRDLVDYVLKRSN